jgi:hypothetical protein
MITLTAEIQLNSGNNVSYSGTFGNDRGNNISDLPLGRKEEVLNPFIIGLSKLGDGGKFYESVPYYIHKDFSDENGLLKSNPFYVAFVAKNEHDTFTMSFDTKNNKFPNSVKVDGQVFFLNSPTKVFNVSLSNTHTVVIDNWNAPNEPIIISGIYGFPTIEINKRNMLSLEGTVMERGDNSLPSWGIISNGGSLSFKDVYGEVANYAESNLLQDGATVEIYLNDTLSGNKENVGTYYSEDWDYDNDNHSASVSFKDDLEEWQEILTDEIEYDFENSEEKNLEWFYKKLHELTPQKYNMTAFEDLDLETKSVLTSTTIKYPYMEDGNLWSSWQKLCGAGLLHIYKEKGKTICRYNGGN